MHLLDHVHHFDPGDDDSSVPKGIESEHRSHSPFDVTVVLFNDVV